MANYIRTRALIGKEDVNFGNPFSQFTRPSSTGATQPMTYIGSLTEKIPVVTDFAGADIGAQTNAAVAALGTGGGELYIPAGSYTYSTPIIIPRQIRLRGSGSGASGHAMTTLVYTGSGAAVVVADTGGGGFQQGGLSDLFLNGPSAGIGIYIGGDPTNTLITSAAYGNNTTFERIQVSNFATGIQFGNNTWINQFNHCFISNNTVGIYCPTGVSNTGENILFNDCSWTGCTNAGTLDTQVSECHFVSCSFDFNGPLTGRYIVADFVCCHFENNTGAFIDDSATGITPAVKIFGGEFHLDQGSGTTAQMFNIGASAGAYQPSFMWLGGVIYVASGQTVTQLVNYVASGSNPLLWISGIASRAAGTILAVTNVQGFFYGLHVDEDQITQTSQIGAYYHFFSGMQVDTPFGGTAGTTLLIRDPTNATNSYLRNASGFLELINSAFSAALIRFPNAGGIVIANNATAPVVTSGQVGLGATIQQTVGAAGGAAAQPATPWGYLLANIGGSVVAIPYHKAS